MYSKSESKTSTLQINGVLYTAFALVLYENASKFQIWIDFNDWIKNKKSITLKSNQSVNLTKYWFVEHFFCIKENAGKNDFIYGDHGFIGNTP